MNVKKRILDVQTYKGRLKLPSMPSKTRTHSVHPHHLIVLTLNHSTVPRTHAHNTNYTK